MKNPLLNLFLALFCLWSSVANAQVTDTANYNFGTWQAFSSPLYNHPEVRGRLCNFFWKDIEVAPNVWEWTQFDSDLAMRAKDGLPIIFMVYTKEDAPDWLYLNGVPKVIEKDGVGNITGYSPYYTDPVYKTYFKRMITKVREHVEALPTNIRKLIIAVQGAYGSTGDYISYGGKNVEAQYELTTADFFSLFKEFSQYYYNEYKNTNPKIYLLSNTKNTGNAAYTQSLWLMQSLPGSWIKNGTLGKGYQLNDELTKSGWLYNLMNSPQSGTYVRTRCELVGNGITSGWWAKAPYKNMFALMCYGIQWGLDWSNQPNAQLDDPSFDSSFNFYNKYAGQKDPAKSTSAMCALKDVIDAADVVRFPTAIYGAATRTTSRLTSVLQPFISYGAKLEDPVTATLNESAELSATGINDVGWDLFPGNYERYLHQITPNVTSAGYWNVQSAHAKSMYGRFARGFDLANDKNALYFDVDNAFLNNAPLDAQYPVMIEVTYLDKGTGKWKLFYDAQNSTNKASIIVTCNNSGLWKKASITLTDAYFGNRGIKGSDFYIKSMNAEDVIFSVVELTRSKPGSSSNTGLFLTSALSAEIQADNAKIIQPKEIMVYPNPVKDIAYLSFEASDEYKYTVELSDITGKLLLQKTDIAQKGLNRVALNVNQYAGGLYIVTLKNDKGERK
ncbi:MAG TPA: T9SS type A sorting domain-containing protein, partial [Chitinophagaceae bacterium]|nr:T9SS type A sorting domain-containing protein [Chitinophagaceae bacterium]